jgi:hypothetical protein
MKGALGLQRERHRDDARDAGDSDLRRDGERVVALQEVELLGLGTRTAADPLPSTTA